jgi:hypothetical protein
MSETEPEINPGLDAHLDEIEAGQGRAAGKKTSRPYQRSQIIQQELCLDGGASPDGKPARSNRSPKSVGEIAAGSKALARIAAPTSHLKKILDVADAIQARPDAGMWPSWPAN